MAVDTTNPWAARKQIVTRNGIEMRLEVKTDLPKLKEAMRAAPQVLLEELATAYNQIGEADIETLRESFGAGEASLNMGRRFGAFRYMATEPKLVTRFDQLFVSEYSKWKAAPIHEDGGWVRARQGAMIVPVMSTRMNSKGDIVEERMKRNAILRGLASGKLQIARLGSGRGAPLAIIRKEKSGQVFVVGYFRRAVKMKKRLDWKGIVTRHANLHAAFIDAALERTFQRAYGR